MCQRLARRRRGDHDLAKRIIDEGADWHAPKAKSDGDDTKKRLFSRNIAEIVEYSEKKEKGPGTITVFEDRLDVR